jgi:hypothetical protein
VTTTPVCRESVREAQISVRGVYAARAMIVAMDILAVVLGLVMFAVLLGLIFGIERI